MKKIIPDWGNGTCILQGESSTENESLQDREENILKLFAILSTLGEKTCLGDTKIQSHMDNILRCAGSKSSRKGIWVR